MHHTAQRQILSQPPPDTVKRRGRHRFLFGGGIEGNHRLTATNGVVLLVLLAVEGLTIFSIRSMFTLHAFVGLLLIPPIALKLASTGYRFIRYYTGNPSYRAAGPPALALRLLAPVLVLLTVVLFGTGVIVLAAGPGDSVWRSLHLASFVFWTLVMTVHVLAYVWRLPRLAGADVVALVRPRRALPGALTRESLVAASLILGVVLAVVFLPLDASWTHVLSGFEG